MGARLSVQSAVLHSNFRVLPLFHPKSPILISQHPNMFSKIVYRYMNSKGLSEKHIKHEIKCYFNTIHQFNPFLQNPRQQLNSYHKSEIMYTQGMNHQQQYLITTIKSIKHDFIKNPSTTIHSSSFMGKTQLYMYILHKHVKFNLHNLIIFNSYTQTLHPNISTNFTN